MGVFLSRFRHLAPARPRQARLQVAGIPFPFPGLHQLGGGGLLNSFGLRPSQSQEAI